MDTLARSARAIDPTPTPAATYVENLQFSSVPVVVTWSNTAQQNNTLHHLSHSTHDHFTQSIHRGADSSTAFFQLRANVALKNRRDRTNLLSVPPENIHTLALVENDGGTELATSRLGTSARCLRFNMRQPPSLIVSKGDIIPKQKASRTVLDSLRALAGQTAFSVHLPAATTSDGPL